MLALIAVLDAPVEVELDDPEMSGGSEQSRGAVLSVLFVPIRGGDDLGPHECLHQRLLPERNVYFPLQSLPFLGMSRGGRSVNIGAVKSTLEPCHGH